ncbi:MAG TPA: hypothetical protein VMZ53_03070 [Kofleriaceae bacterium]|nr:hypothetical protein [Kofleriaceae bacterium]
MRLVCAAALVAAVGCSKSPSDETLPPEPDPKGWTITVDMSGLDRFVQPGDSTSWPVGGVATATEGLATVKVNDALVDVDASGAFVADVTVAPGLTRVPILATDDAGHERKADRTLLAAQFLADGDYNGSAAGLVLTDAILGAMSESIAGYASDVNIAAEILSRDVLSQDDRCVTWPVQARQGTVTAALVEDAGNLWLHIRVPNLYVYFEGSCQGLISQIPIAGQMGGTIDVWTRLTAKPPVNGDACLSAFDHTRPQVSITGWGFDVWGTSGPLQAWIVDLFAGNKSTEARNQLTTEVGGRADEMLGTKLADVSVYEKTSELDLLGRPLALDLCVSGIEKTAQSTLVARIAARATGAGMREAPGAPQLAGAVVRPAANELVLDGNLIGQLLFASWRDNGLTRTAPDIDAGILQVLMPGLAKEFPDATTAQVWIEAELPPLVRVTPEAAADLSVELGDLMIDVSIDGKRVLRFGAVLTLSLDLTPMNGALVPAVVDTKATVALLDERHDGPDAALEQAVQVQIGSAASKLLGDGAAIALPSLPGLGAPVAVTPDAGGRYLRIKLQ